MAGKIPQHFIDDLLARVNIVDVIDGRVKLKRAGKNYSALCPFHKEKSPSFSVSPDKQFYYCFGCGAGGNAIGFLMEFERLSFPEAVEELARLVGVEVPRENDHAVDVAREQRIKGQFSLLEQASQFFQHSLRHHAGRDAAVSYLKKRQLTGQTAAQFQIGYAPPGWDNLINHLHAAEQPELLKQLEATGLAIHNEQRDSYYDRFRERIIFPIRDMRGRTIGFGGRVLTDEKPKYLNSPETETFHKGRELYGLYEARQATNRLERLLIVEGYMDVVSLAQNGISWAVATLGTATTAHHLERIFKMVPEVIFCFDGDEAGRNAARRALDTTLPVIVDGKQARFLFLPDGEDPDTLIQKEGTEAFTQRVQGALPLSEFFFQHLTESHDLSSMDGRARFANDALPLVQGMQPGLLQQMMLDRLCEITGLSLDQLNSVIDLHRATESTPPATPRQSQPKASAPAIASEYADNYAPSDYPDEPAGYEDYSPAPSKRMKSAQGINLVNSIISLLMHHPEQVARLPAAQEFGAVQEHNIDLLIALTEYLQSTPGASLGTLLVDWQTSPERMPQLMLLNEITTSDPVVGDVDAGQLLDEAVKRLLSRKSETMLDALLKKSRQGPLSDSEKQQLQQLLTQRHLH